MANAGELIIDNKLLKEIQSIDKALKSSQNVVRRCCPSTIRGYSFSSSSATASIIVPTK